MDLDTSLQSHVSTHVTLRRVCVVIVDNMEDLGTGEVSTGVIFESLSYISILDSYRSIHINSRYCILSLCRFGALIYTFYQFI